MNTRQNEQSMTDPLADFDIGLLKALCEPARLELIRLLALSGPSDVGGIAERMTQDRSVVSRHLQTLERAGLVWSVKDGRHTIYALDGPAIASRMEQMAARIRAAMDCCCPPKPR